MNIFGIGIGELLFVLVVALLVLGPGKMLDLARSLGKYVRELQRVSSELPRLLTMEDEQPPPQRQQVYEPPSQEPPAPPSERPVPRE